MENYKLHCSFCNSIIIDCGKIKNKTQRDEQLKNAFYYLSETENFVLCKNCNNIIKNNKFKKIIKPAKEFGNSSHIILPHNWKDKNIIAYKLD